MCDWTGRRRQGDLDMAYTPLIGVGSSSSSSTSAAVSSCVLKIRLRHRETRKY